MEVFGLVFFLLLCSARVLAAPTADLTVSSETYERLRRFAYFAQAPYCVENDQEVSFEQPRPLSCPNGACGTLPQEVEIYKAYPPLGASERATGFVGVDNQNRLVVFAIRGTNGWKDVLHEVRTFNNETGYDYFPECPPQGILKRPCVAAEQVGIQWTPIRKQVFKTISRLLQMPKFRDYEVAFVGHSLGAAVATFAVTDYRAHYPYSPKPRSYLYSYASPRVFNLAFATYAQGLSDDNFRVSHYKDIVPRNPFSSLGYYHIGPEYYISGISLKSQDRDSITMLRGDKSHWQNPLESTQGIWKWGSGEYSGEERWHADYLITISSSMCKPGGGDRPLYPDLPQGPQVPARQNAIGNWNNAGEYKESDGNKNQDDSNNGNDSDDQNDSQDQSAETQNQDDDRNGPGGSDDSEDKQKPGPPISAGGKDSFGNDDSEDR